MAITAAERARLIARYAPDMTRDSEAPQDGPAVRRARPAGATAATGGWVEEALGGLAPQQKP